MNACGHPDGCPRPARTKGWCQTHWRRILRQGDPGPAYIRGSRKGCLLEGCERPVKARGWCEPHWRRIRRYGDPGAVEIRAPRSLYPRVEVLAEWGWLIDPELSKAENCRRLAPRLGMDWRALERAIERAKVAA